MPEVYSTAATERPFPIGAFLRASGLHVGAAAAAAALRRDLVEQGFVTEVEFDEAFAAARVTPGTNLLAMYVILGERLAGWRGAALALGAGTVIPAAIVGLIASAYVSMAGHPLLERAMQGARAGALAVLLWAAVRLLRPQIAQHQWPGVTLMAVTLVVTLALSASPLPVLLIAGGIGATVLRRGE